MILAFDFACTKVAWFGSTLFSHIYSKMLKSFLTRLIHDKSSKHGSTRDDIAQGNFVEHSQSILHAPHIWHECQQDYFWQRYLTQNDFCLLNKVTMLWMICLWVYMASSECHCNGTRIQHCHKHERILVAHFPVEFVAILGLPSVSAYSSHIPIL